MLPDLVIEDARIEPSNPSLLRVKVANVGILAAAQTELTLTIRREGEIRTTTVGVPLLKAGDRQWLSIALGLRAVRTDEVVLRIDDPPRLEESDEANNAFVYR